MNENTFKLDLLALMLNNVAEKDKPLQFRSWLTDGCWW